jgi:hypothetical protein
LSLMQFSCVITTLVCGPSLMPISTPRHPDTSKKHGNRQADGGGNVSHMIVYQRIFGLGS